MRVLVVHHGRLPSPDAPCTGGARRAAVHIEALRGAGHDVSSLARAQDEPGGFASPGELTRRALAARPDWILCVTPEDAPALASVAPLMVDLYAPRLLESAFEGLQEQESGRALAALEAADEVLFSNPRQRWFWSGLAGAAGWDLSRPVGALVPLAALPGPAHVRSEGTRKTFLVGGNPWPWQDVTDTLHRAVRFLGDRADVVSVGLPAVAGVHALPQGSLAGWLTHCAQATAALDRYAPNPERTLAMSFRQMDYLGAGVPVITDIDTPLADDVRRFGAGWVDESLEDALEQALLAPRSSFALAARLHPTLTEAPVLAWQPRRRDRPWSHLQIGARLYAAEARAEHEAAARVAADTEVIRKRGEVDALHAQTRALTASVEALSTAMMDVAGFRRETVQVLGTRLASGAADAEHLRRELEIARADLDKKNVELQQVQDERDRMARSFPFLRRNRG